MYQVVPFEITNVYRLDFDPVSLYLARGRSRVIRQAEEQRPLWHMLDEPWWAARQDDT